MSFIRTSSNLYENVLHEIILSELMNKTIQNLNFHIIKRQIQNNETFYQRNNGFLVLK